MNSESEDKQLRKLFQTKFEKETQVPPPASWKAIKGSLPIQKVPFFGAKFWLSTVAGVVGVAFVLNYFLNDSQNPVQTSAIFNQEIQTTDSIEEPKNSSANTQISKDENSKTEIENVTSKTTTNDQKTERGETENKSIQLTQKTNSKNTTDSKENLTKTGHPTKKTDVLVSKKTVKKGNKQSGISQVDKNKQVTTISEQMEGSLKGTHTDNPNTIIKTTENKSTNQQDKEKETQLPKVELVTKTQSEEKFEASIENDQSTKNEEEFKNSKTIDIVDEKLPTTKLVNTRFVTHQLDKTLVALPPFMPKEIASISKFGLEIYSGIGRNTRTIKSTFDAENLTNKDLDGKKVRLRNKFLGVSGTYNISPVFAVQGGLAIGVNRFRSRIFEKQVIQEADNSNYRFKTADGNLELASSELKSYYADSDTTVLKMRLYYRSSYFSIPLALKISLPGNKLIPYFKLGASYDQKMRARSTLVVINNGQTATYRLKKIQNERASSIQTIIGFGFTTNSKSGTNFFFEPYFSLPVTDFVKLENLKISSRFFQIKAGLSISF